MFKVIAFFWISFTCFAEEPPEHLDTLLEEAEVAPQPSQDRPEIEVKKYGVTIVRKSPSGRVYLIDSPTGAHPAPGTLIMLRDGETNLMSLRVLKTYYEDGDLFAARTVHNYVGAASVSPGIDVLAMEKLRDIEYVEVPVSTPYARTESAPLASEPGTQSEEPLPEVLAFDPELDPASSPMPDPFLNSEEMDASFAAPHRISVTDIEELDPYKHWLSAGVALFTTILPTGTTSAAVSFSGGPQVQYAYSIGKELFLNRPKVQDSLEAEGSLGFFSRKNLASASTHDLYSVLVPGAQLRYSLKFSPNFSIYFHAGALMTFLVNAQNGSPAITTKLRNQIIPAIGGGAFFRIGPKWFIRVHAGFESFQGCLALRF